MYLYLLGICILMGWIFVDVFIFAWYLYCDGLDTFAVDKDVWWEVGKVGASLRRNF